jgi:hypothetical protein
MTKAQQAERTEAIDKLREWIKPGDTVYTILQHVSRSGMSRHIRVVVPEGCWLEHTAEQMVSIHGPKDMPPTRMVVDHIHPNFAIGQVLRLRHARRNGHVQDALVVNGCGMDMGFHPAALYGRDTLKHRWI